MHMKFPPFEFKYKVFYTVNSHNLDVIQDIFTAFAMNPVIFFFKTTEALCYSITTKQNQCTFKCFVMEHNLGSDKI